MQTSRSTSRARRGFTMIELLAVVLIMAVLAAFAIGNFSNNINPAREATVKTDVDNGVQGALAFYATHGNAFTGIDTTAAKRSWLGTVLG